MKSLKQARFYQNLAFTASILSLNLSGISAEAQISGQSSSSPVAAPGTSTSAGNCAGANSGTRPVVQSADVSKYCEANPGQGITIRNPGVAGTPDFCTPGECPVKTTDKPTDNSCLASARENAVLIKIGGEISSSTEKTCSYGNAKLEPSDWVEIDNYTQNEEASLPPYLQNYNYAAESYASGELSDTEIAIKNYPELILIAEAVKRSETSYSDSIPKVANLNLSGFAAEAAPEIEKIFKNWVVVVGGDEKEQANVMREALINRAYAENMQNGNIYEAPGISHLQDLFAFKSDPTTNSSGSNGNLLALNQQKANPVPQKGNTCCICLSDGDCLYDENGNKSTSFDDICGNMVNNNKNPADNRRCDIRKFFNSESPNVSQAIKDFTLANNCVGGVENVVYFHGWQTMVEIGGLVDKKMEKLCFNTLIHDPNGTGINKKNINMLSCLLLQDKRRSADWYDRTTNLAKKLCEKFLNFEISIKMYFTEGLVNRGANQCWFSNPTGGFWNPTANIILNCNNGVFKSKFELTKCEKLLDPNSQLNTCRGEINGQKARCGEHVIDRKTGERRYLETTIMCWQNRWRRA